MKTRYFWKSFKKQIWLNLYELFFNTGFIILRQNMYDSLRSW